MVKKESAEVQDTFLWHKVDDEEREQIREEAKQIMEDFGKALEQVGESDGFVSVERDSNTRKESIPWKSDAIFRKIMFENAPKKTKDCLIAEKGEWTK